MNNPYKNFDELVEITGTNLESRFALKMELASLSFSIGRKSRVSFIQFG